MLPFGNKHAPQIEESTKMAAIGAPYFCWTPLLVANCSFYTLSIARHSSVERMLHKIAVFGSIQQFSFCRSIDSQSQISYFCPHNSSDPWCVENSTESYCYTSMSWMIGVFDTLPITVMCEGVLLDVISAPRTITQLLQLLCQLIVATLQVALQSCLSGISQLTCK